LEVRGSEDRGAEQEGSYRRSKRKKSHANQNTNLPKIPTFQTEPDAYSASAPVDPID